MKKLLLLSLLMLGCQEDEIDICQCSKYTYESRVVQQNGLFKLKYVEINRETTECQDENEWTEDKYMYKIKCY